VSGLAVNAACVVYIVMQPPGVRMTTLVRLGNLGDNMIKVRVIVALSGVLLPALSLAASGSIPKSNLDALALLRRRG